MLALGACGDDSAVPTRDGAVADGGASDAGADAQTDAPSSPANLGLSDSVHDYSGVLVGTSSAFSVMVQNRGGSPSQLPSAALNGNDASQYSVSTAGCSAPVPAGGACTLSVSFAPTTRGQKVATLTVSAGGLSIGTVTLTGIGLRPPTLTSNPLTKAYASAAVNMDGAAQTFTITNDGDVASVALATSLAGTNPGDFVIGAQTCMGMTLAPSGTCIIPVTFHPTALGARAGSLVISAGGGIMTTVALTGTGAPVLEGTPASHDFGSDSKLNPSNPAPATWTVTNHGTSPLTLSLSGSGDTGTFSVGGGTCPTVTPAALGAGMSCTIQISVPAPGLGVPQRVNTATYTYSGGGFSTSFTATVTITL